MDSGTSLPADLRVALVHDWLTGMRGGEKVLEVFCDLFPRAEVFTLVHVRGTVSPAIERHRVHASFVSSLPLARRLYRHALPLFPVAVEQFDLDRFDLVLSTSHCAVKSAIKRGGRLPSLLLSDPDAVRLGPVRCLLRSGPDRSDPLPPDEARRGRPCSLGR